MIYPESFYFVNPVLRILVVFCMIVEGKQARHLTVITGFTKFAKGYQLRK